MLNWRAAAKHYRDGGLDRVLEVLSARHLIPAWLFHYYRAEILTLGKLNPKAVKPRLANYEYGVATRGDAGELAAVSGAANTQSMKRSLESFFDRGNQCFVARRAGRVVGYLWTWHSIYTVTNDNYRKRQFHIGLRPHEVMFGDAYIDSGHRLRGLYPELIRLAVESYPGDFSFYTVVSRLNDHSLKSNLRLGFEPALTVACRLFGPLPYCWTARGADRSVSFFAWNQPRVDLEALCGNQASTATRDRMKTVMVGRESGTGG